MDSLHRHTLTGRNNQVEPSIPAYIRYSQDTGKGAWKVIELGAEASVSDREFWKQSQSELYYQLAGQLQTLWSNESNNSNGAAEIARMVRRTM